MDRVEPNEEDVLLFSGESDADKVDHALISAHNIVLTMLELQQTHFKLDALEEPLQQCLRDFKTIWKTEDAPQSVAKA